MSWKETSPVERSRRRQAIRALIQGENILTFVLETADRLAKMADSEEKWIDSAKVGALKAAADIKLRVLDKVLPDLKSIEHDLGEGFQSMTDEELHGRIADLSKRLADKGILAGGPIRIGAVVVGETETVQ